MLQPDARARPACKPQGNLGLGLRTLGISLGLHGAALAGVVLFGDLTPPEPYAIVAVEMVGATDVAGRPGEHIGEPSSPSHDNAEASADAGENMPDIGSLADIAPAAGESSGSTSATVATPALRETAPPPSQSPRVTGKVAAPDTLAEVVSQLADTVPAAGASSGSTAATPDQRETAPAPPSGSPRVTENAAAAVAEAMFQVPPVPRRKPVPRTSIADFKTTAFSESLRIAKNVAVPNALADTMFQVPPAPRHKPMPATSSTDSRMAVPALVSEVAQTDTGRAVAGSQPTTTLHQERHPVMAALQATVRGSSRAGEPGENPERLPRYAVGGFSNAAPRYPYLARRQGQEGQVVLRVQVSARGDPVSVRVQQSSGYRLLDQAAIKAVKTWRFAPARRGAFLVAGSMDVPVSFKLMEK